MDTFLNIQYIRNKKDHHMIFCLKTLHFVYKDDFLEKYSATLLFFHRKQVTQISIFGLLKPLKFQKGAFTSCF